MYDDFLIWLANNIRSNDPWNVSAEKIRTAFSDIVDTTERNIVFANVGGAIYTIPVQPSSPAITVEKTIIPVLTPGTYTNFGGVVLPEGHFGLIFKNGEAYSIQTAILPTAPVTGIIEEGNAEAVSGGVVFNSIEEVNVLEISRNLVNTNDPNYLIDKIMQSNGTIIDSVSGVVTGFIAVKPNAYYTPSLKRNVNYYDANYNRLGNIPDTRTDLYFQAPATAKYIRWSGYSGNLRLIEGQFDTFPDLEVPNNNFYIKLKKINGSEIEVSKLNNTALDIVNHSFNIDLEVNKSLIQGDLVGTDISFNYGKIEPNTNDFINDNYHLKQVVIPRYDLVNGSDNDVVRLLISPKVDLTINKYYKYGFYALSKNENITPYTNLIRLGSSASPTQSLVLISNVKINDTTWLRKYETLPIINDTYDGLTPVLTYQYFRNFENYNEGDYIYFGFTFYENDAINFNTPTLPSWEFVIKDEIRKLKDNTQETNKELNTIWNNVGYNRSYVSSFLRKKQRKEVDEFNELIVTLMGTSSFGREYSADTSSDNDYPLSPLGDRYGINEEYQNITYYLRQILKFENEDVVFSPAVNDLSELTKDGTWEQNETNDFVRLTRSTTAGNSINIDVSNYNFVKVYFIGTANIFIDNVLIESIVSLDEGKSSNKRYNVVGKGNLRIESVGTSSLNIWGFERWNNPKVCVLNNAVGGTTSSAFINNWGKWSKGLDLATYQIPGGNDTSTTNSGFFKGKKEPNSAGITTGLNFFIYANTTGTYINYGNLILNKGEYAEWNGTEWVKGSTRVNQDLDNWYNNMKTLLDNVLPSGCPHIGIVQHKVGWINDRPWQWDIIKLSRSMWQERGIALIDMFDKSEKLGSFLADGTHYKHNMALSYAEEYARIFNFDLETYYTEKYIPYVTNSLKSDVIEANASYVPSIMDGNSSATSVNFNVPFNTIPKVRIFNNNSIVITGVTQEGFTITGSGSYDWEAYI